MERLAKVIVWRFRSRAKSKMSKKSKDYLSNVSTSVYWNTLLRSLQHLYGGDDDSQVLHWVKSPSLQQEPLRLLHEQLPLPLDTQQVFECLPYVQYIILVLILILLIPIVLNLFWGMNSFGNPVKGMNHFPRIKCP